MIKKNKLKIPSNITIKELNEIAEELMDQAMENVEDYFVNNVTDMLEDELENISENNQPDFIYNVSDLISEIIIQKIKTKIKL